MAGSSAPAQDHLGGPRSSHVEALARHGDGVVDDQEEVGHQDEQQAEEREVHEEGPLGAAGRADARELALQALDLLRVRHLELHDDGAQEPHAAQLVLVRAPGRHRLLGLPELAEQPQVARRRLHLLLQALGFHGRAEPCFALVRREAELGEEGHRHEEEGSHCRHRARVRLKPQVGACRRNLSPHAPPCPARATTKWRQASGTTQPPLLPSTDPGQGLARNGPWGPWRGPQDLQ
mmetsp:Transcript_102739/g.311835  ORF Transcript_102739/g.311835 Transcript_102739/m.311835 type:complete len:235 (+) Transcript_102739:53-757(+)